MIAALRRLPPVETAVLAVALAILVAFAVVRAHARAQAAAPPLASYSTYDASAGGYRALYELLAREDGPVTRFERRPAFLGDGRDGEIGTLVYAEPLPFDPRALHDTPADVAALERWVRGGGRLVYLGRDDVAAEHGVLGLPKSLPARGPGSHASTPYVAPDLARAGVGAIASDAPRRYALSANKIRLLLADARGPLAVAYPFGAGEVIALVDESLFANENLATGDRARLAAALVPAPARGALAFDESAHGHLAVEHWWQIVPRSLLVALALGAAVAAVALAGAAVRLGPPLVPEPRDDRTSGDFARAAASLAQRARASRQALHGAFVATTRTIARANGLASDAGTRELASRIESASARADYLRLADLARVEQLADDEFVRGIALARILRTEMTRDARARR